MAASALVRRPITARVECRRAQLAGRPGTAECGGREEGRGEGVGVRNAVREGEGGEGERGAVRQGWEGTQGGGRFEDQVVAHPLSPIAKLAMGLSSQTTFDASCKPVLLPQPRRLDVYKVMGGARTQWQLEWEAEKREARRREREAGKKLVDDMRVALGRVSFELRELREERQEKEEALAALVRKQGEEAGVLHTLEADQGSLEEGRWEVEERMRHMEEALAMEGKENLTLEHMHAQRLETFLQMERKREFLASCVVEASDQLRDVGEKRDVRPSSLSPNHPKQIPLPTAPHYHCPPLYSPSLPSALVHSFTLPYPAILPLTQFTISYPSFLLPPSPTKPTLPYPIIFPLLSPLLPLCSPQRYHSCLRSACDFYGEARA